jgi:cobalt/nickel transport system ATP-binding protein
VGHGEQISIIGSNGSGKSTLLAILNGLIYPTSGEFYAFDNEIIEEVFDSVKDNEFSLLFPNKSGIRLLKFRYSALFANGFRGNCLRTVAAQCHSEEVKKRVEDVLEMMEIAKLRDGSPHTFSGGEKKKVCLATVLLMLHNKGFRLKINIFEQSIAILLSYEIAVGNKTSCYDSLPGGGTG